MKTFRLIHISDPHFGTTTDQKVAALVSTIKDLGPDLIALSGDITQRGHADQFIAAKAFCESLAEFKILAIPGNHDIPLFNLAARVFRPYHHFKNTFGFPLNSNLRLGSVEILGLNTTHPKRHVQGELYKKELALLHTFTKESNIRIVMFHQPLDCAHEADEKNLLISAEEILPDLEKAQVDIVLSGHIHDPLARLSSVRYPKCLRPLVVCVAGTCLSSRTRSGAPNSFNVLELSGPDIKPQDSLKDEIIDLKVTRYDLNSAGHFKPLSQAQFQRDSLKHWRSH